MARASGLAACALVATVVLALAELPLPKADARFESFDPALVELGQLLFYDPVLSGGQTVSCATCHHPRFATGDGVALGLGDGGRGMGPDRVADPANLPEERIPRNAPALFNLGASEFTVMFHDGRLEADSTRPGGIRTPLGEDMAEGFASVLSAQSMFPVLSPDEMAGHYGESDVSRAVRQGLLTGPGGAWDIIASRVAAIPEYRARFDAALGEGAEIGFTDISDAIAAFIATEWRADDSAFDRYLRDGTPLPEDAARGMDLFYGEAGCGTCHAGQFQTDHEFHAIAMPQFGPGKAARFEGHARDTGRMRVTGNPGDAYAFRTPSLRNVSFTAPYGHDGAFADLKGVIRHHLDPVGSLRAFTLDARRLPALEGVEDDWVLRAAPEVEAIAAANELEPQVLSDGEVDDLIAFLHALDDPAAVKGRLGVPDAVPSGLPVDR
jgi:cytochrome c peroxidase